MADLPPSYNEVVNNSAVQRDQPSVTPSAPRLEAIVTNPDLANTQGQPSKRGAPHPSAHNDGRFSAWDDTATEMLIANRLRMNERFERAQNQQERDELWDVILNHLLTAGYSFARIDLIQYWEYQFYTYKSIVNSLTAGTQSDSTWKYFELMDGVFKYSSEVPISKLSGEGDYAAVVSSPAFNTFGGLTNLGPISNALPSEAISSDYIAVQSERVITSQPNPTLSIPAENGVVTIQPSTLAHGYIPIAPNRNRDDDDDDCNCCCIGCCDDNSGRYSGRTGGYTSHNENYNTFGHTDGYNSGYTNDGNANDYTSEYIADDSHCLTSSHTDGGNTYDSCDTGGGDYGGCDSGGGGTDDGCCDSGGGGTDD